MTRSHTLSSFAFAALVFATFPPMLNAQVTSTPGDPTRTTSQAVAPDSIKAPPTSPHESSSIDNSSTNNASTQDAAKPGSMGTGHSTAVPTKTRENTARPESRTGINPTLPSHDNSQLNR